MKPKEMHPGQLVMITRRTAHRQYAWRPGQQSRELFGYLYAKACNDYGQEPVVATLMSNHVHTMLHDVTGRRSKWMQQLFSTSTRKRNLQLDRRENLWATEAPGDMPVLDMDKVVDQVLYVVLQAVTAGLIEKSDEWSGFKIMPRDWGKPMVFKRPDVCSKDMPPEIEITPMPPPGFRDRPLDEVIAFFEDLIAKAEQALAKKRKGRPVLGLAYCEALNPKRTPKTKAPMRTRNPRFTSSDPILIARAIKQLREFNAWHRQALNAFRDGRRDVEFPAGTIHMAQRAGCRCATAAADHPLSLRTTWSHDLQSSWDTWLAAR